MSTWPGDQTGRTHVVTGGNSGVGLTAARALATAGGTVVLASRRLDSARRAAAQLPGAVQVLELDLADLDQVARAGAELAERFRSINSLILNAGVMGGSYRTTAQGHEMQMGTNVLGHFAFAAAGWPSVVAAGGRVVWVSSIAARSGDLTSTVPPELLTHPEPYRAQLVYARTKQADLLLSQELQRRAVTAGRTAISVAAHPGVSRSNLFGRQLHDQGLPGFVAQPAGKALGLFLQSAAAGGAPTVRAATDPGVTGGAFVGPRRFNGIRGPAEILGLFEVGRDHATAASLWDACEQVTGVAFTV